MGKYKTINEMYKAYDSHPITSDFAKLSPEEQEEYFQVYGDMLASFDVYGDFDELKYRLLIQACIDRGHEYSSEFAKGYAKVAAKVMTDMQEEVLKSLHEYKPIPIKMYDCLDKIIYYISGEAYRYGIPFENKSMEINILSGKVMHYYDNLDVNACMERLRNGESFESIIRIFGGLAEHNPMLLSFCKEVLYKNVVSPEEVCRCISLLTNQNQKFVLADIIKEYDSEVWYGYLYDNIDLLVQIFQPYLDNENYDAPEFSKLCKIYSKHIQNYDGNIRITDDVYAKFKKTIGQGHKYVTEALENINKLYKYGLLPDTFYDDCFGEVLNNNIKVFRLYQGKTIPEDIRIFMLTKRAKADETIAEKASTLFGKINKNIYTHIFKKIVISDASLIKYYQGDSFQLYEIAIKRGVKVDKRILMRFLTQNNDLTKGNINTIFKYWRVNLFDYLALKSYKYDPVKLMDSFVNVEYLLKFYNIDRDYFIQYAFASSYDWLEAMLNIFENNRINDFARVKDYFFKNYYSVDEKSISILTIKSFVDLLKNYNNYRELCVNLCNTTLTDEDKDKLRLLFDNKNHILNEDGSPIKNKDELMNIQNIIFNNYKVQIAEAINENNLKSMKDILCEILFNMDSEDAQDMLSMYGSVEDLRLLIFDNRENRENISMILEMMSYVSMIEDIENCNNIDKLKSMLLKIINNQDVYTLCQKCNMLFKSFEEKINKLYLADLKTNLTDLDSIPNILVNKKLTAKYGVKFIDLSRSKYCLLEHVLSERETVDTLVNGKAKGDQLFISLSLGSHKGQTLYCNGYGIIFGCSKLTDSSFVKSSVTNMGSNGFIDEYSYEVDKGKSRDVKERGALRTSSAETGHNSEILCYREGLKFDCIVITGDREPTKEEISIAKKYNLSFVRVQEKNKAIENPKPIYRILKNTDNHQEGKYEENQDISNTKTVLSETKKESPRRIAIFTDAHGLFEPTLAILEDARRNGITEIYSLGDNIGTGPNPKEVMDLLEIYGVRSLKGNHEMYALDEIEKLKEHLEKTNALEEAERNGKWTRTKLTEEQLEKIRNLPENLTIEIGGKKIMLCHYSSDYNTGEKQDIPSDINEVFQGHIHFEGSNDNIKTVRAVGFGNTNGKNNQAGYMILTEREDGGYDTEFKTVYYNSKFSEHDIIESDMNSEDKDKITSWIGRSR